MYDDCGVKLTIPYQAKDVEGSTNPQIGDKVRELRVLLGNAVLGIVGVSFSLPLLGTKGGQGICVVSPGMLCLNDLIFWKEKIPSNLVIYRWGNSVLLCKWCFLNKEFLSLSGHCLSRRN